MISQISNVSQISPISSYTNGYRNSGGINYDTEDQAIISAQARLYNAVEQYQAGTSNELKLIIESQMTKHQIDAEVSVINIKTEIFDEILKLGEDE